MLLLLLLLLSMLLQLGRLPPPATQPDVRFRQDRGQNSVPQRKCVGRAHDIIYAGGHTAVSSCVAAATTATSQGATYAMVVHSTDNSDNTGHGTACAAAAASAGACDTTPPAAAAMAMAISESHAGRDDAADSRAYRSFQSHSACAQRLPCRSELPQGPTSAADTNSNTSVDRLIHLFPYTSSLFHGMNWHRQGLFWPNAGTAALVLVDGARSHFAHTQNTHVCVRRC